MLNPETFHLIWIRIQPNFWYGSESREVLRIRRIQNTAASHLYLSYYFPLLCHELWEARLLHHLVHEHVRIKSCTEGCKGCWSFAKLVLKDWSETKQKSSYNSEPFCQRNILFRQNFSPQIIFSKKSLMHFVKNSASCVDTDTWAVDIVWAALTGVHPANGWPPTRPHASRSHSGHGLLFLSL